MTEKDSAVEIEKGGALTLVGKGKVFVCSRMHHVFTKKINIRQRHRDAGKQEVFQTSCKSEIIEKAGGKRAYSSNRGQERGFVALK